MKPVILLDRVAHPSWKHIYTLVPHVGNKVSLTFDDGQRIFFDPSKVLWEEIARTVAMWERMQGIIP